MMMPSHYTRDLSYLRSFTCCLILLGFVLVEVEIQAQDTTGETEQTDLATQYQQLYSKHQQELKSLAEKCVELQKPELARFTLKWVPRRDPAREYLYVLPTNRDLAFPKLSDRTDKLWLEYLQKHNSNYAAGLMQLASKANEQGRAEFAFRLLHECLFHDPQHQAATKVLGVPQNEFQVRANPFRKREKLFPDGEIVKYESDHFQLYTSLASEQAKAAIAKFERWYVVWRQTFYAYWAHSSYMSRRFEVGAKPVRRSKKFQVVLYRNRQEYVEKLKSVSPGIEVSVGYYLFPQKTSFFYVGDGADETTWVHELTHQFMHETIPVSTKSEIRSSIWAVEGIAMFMESLCDFRTHVTLGGEDAERLNYCRHNFFRRGFFVEMSKLNAMNQRDFVASGQVKGLYSLSAAYCHFLMRKPAIKREFLKFLQMVHQGKNAQVFFDRIANQISFDEGFKDFLKPSKEKLEPSLIRPAGYEILYLGNSDVDDQTLRMLKYAVNLESLDLSDTKITGAGLMNLAQLKKLRYLSLERTGIGDSAMGVIGTLRSLEELDLTTTGLTDNGLDQLNGLTRLVALWVAGTRITDTSIEKILLLPKLTQVDIRKTGISATGKKRLNGSLKLVD